MATCFCEQPCERHKFPMLRTEEQVLKAAEDVGLVKKSEYEENLHAFVKRCQKRFLEFETYMNADDEAKGAS